jgi:succinate dehydrogenase/fumarate reductase flavoprotein subunit
VRRARASRGRSQAHAHGAGRVGIRPSSTADMIDRKAIEADIDVHLNGYQRSLFRSEAQLATTADLLDEHWRTLRDHAHARGSALVALRETAALTATARWCTAAAGVRVESRGLHVRVDAPDLDPIGGIRLLTGGLDTVWTRPERSLLAEAAE